MSAPAAEPTRVVLVLDDVDRHGEGCRCGRCNHVGKSYGVAVFRADDRDRADPVDRIYACSEESAFHNAKTECARAGYVVVPETEEE